MGRPLTRQLQNAPARPELRVKAWRQLAVRTRRRAENGPHTQAWMCTPRYAGAGHAPGPPYSGGLQLDIPLPRRYGAGLLGRKGTADHWTPLEQMWTAERAHRSGRGFYPWPNTARYCGLI